GNAAEPAGSLGVSEPTVRHYLDLLTGVFMVRQLAPWHENLKKRQVRAPKIYLRDSGLLHALLGIESERDLLAHPKSGASWEGFIRVNGAMSLPPTSALSRSKPWRARGLTRFAPGTGRARRQGGKDRDGQRGRQTLR